MKTPWGLISAQYDLWTPEAQGQPSPAQPQGRKLLGGGRGDPLAHAARRLAQQAAAAGAGPQGGAAAPGLPPLPANSSIAADYDVDQTKLGPTKTGAPGTYNYLIDAILAVPRTRQMCVEGARMLRRRGAELRAAGGLHVCRGRVLGASLPFHQLRKDPCLLCHVLRRYMRRVRTLMDTFMATGRLQVGAPA